jgi:succinate dehydrogenase / fumarate reductase cytochrome b subunit
MQGPSCCSFLRSTLGLKIVMALTGLVLLGFLAGHVAGNLLIFVGPQKLNDYARFLKSNPAVLWGVRFALLAAVGAHVLAAVRLTKLKAAARPVPYAGKQAHGSSYASRTMMWSGPVIALFVVYHLLHFTTGHLHHSRPNFVAENVYQNVVGAFSRPAVAVVYIVALLGLGFHLSHGIWSTLQTLGLNRPHLDLALRRAGLAVAALIVGGFIAIPVAVLVKLVSGG